MDRLAEARKMAEVWKLNDERNKRLAKEEEEKRRKALRLKWRRTGSITWPWVWYDPETGWEKRMAESPEDYYPDEAKRTTFLLQVQFEEIDSKRPDWENYW